MKTPSSFFVGALFAMLPVFSPSAGAQVLVKYAAGTSADVTALQTAGSVASGITASGTLTGNGSLLAFTASGAASPNNVLYAALSSSAAADVQTGLSEGTTVTNGTYFSFTLTANSGQALSLSSLTFNADVSGTSSPRVFYVLDSADNYVQSNTLATDNNAGGTLTTTLNAYTVNLTGAPYQNLSTITFKFYIATPSTGNNVGFNNIVVNGTVSAVPEPATAWLLVAGGVAAAGGMRRRLHRGGASA